MANCVQARKTGDAAKRLRADCALSGSTGGLFKTSVKMDNPVLQGVVIHESSNRL